MCHHRHFHLRKRLTSLAHTISFPEDAPALSVRPPSVQRSDHRWHLVRRARPLPRASPPVVRTWSHRLLIDEEGRGRRTRERSRVTSGAGESGGGRGLTEVCGPELGTDEGHLPQLRLVGAHVALARGLPLCAASEARSSCRQGVACAAPTPA